MQKKYIGGKIIERKVNPEFYTEHDFFFLFNEGK